MIDFKHNGQPDDRHWAVVYEHREAIVSSFSIAEQIRDLLASAEVLSNIEERRGPFILLRDRPTRTRSRS